MRRIQIVLAVLVVGIGLSGQALADVSQDAARAGAPTAARPHCVVTAQDERTMAPVPGPRCFPTFAEAVAEATNGAVRLPANARTLEQSDLDAGRTLTHSAGTMATVIGIEYENSQFGQFGGWSYVIQSTNSRGCSGYSYRVSSLPSSRDNAISSAKSYSGCRSAHFSGINLTGSKYLCSCTSMGAMNDRTSSIKFSSSGARD